MSLSNIASNKVVNETVLHTKLNSFTNEELIRYVKGREFSSTVSLILCARLEALMSKQAYSPLGEK